MKFQIRILGSSSATPTRTRHPSAQLVNFNEKLYLIDCGEGTQMQLRKYRIKLQRIDHIFISHLHGDHFFGLVGLVSSMHLLGRNKPLYIYGPAPLKDILELQLTASDTDLVYPMHFHAIDAESHSAIFENEELTIETIPLDHRIPTTGFRFGEKKKKRKIKKEVIKNLNVPVEMMDRIKAGEDFTDDNGKVFKNDFLTYDPPDPRSFAYCSDTKYSESVIPAIQHSDVLYHEATFTHDKEDIAADKYHSTARQAAMVAKKAGAGKLLLGHYSARYTDLKPILDEAREIFPDSHLAEEGKIFNINYK